jgi:hypothetical protein
MFGSLYSGCPAVPYRVNICFLMTPRSSVQALPKNPAAKHAFRQAV